MTLLLVTPLDPIQYVTANTIDVSLELSNDKTYFLVSGVSNSLLLTNPPVGDGIVKDIWIKNFKLADLTVSADATTIDGLSDVSLLGAPALTINGDAIHLLWSDTLSQWIIVGKYSNI